MTSARRKSDSCVIPDSLRLGASPWGDTQFLTFIALAPNGCNLRCAFCVIRPFASNAANNADVQLTVDDELDCLRHDCCSEEKFTKNVFNPLLIFFQLWRSAVGPVSNSLGKRMARQK
jgi:hypothetical protein